MVYCLLTQQHLMTLFDVKSCWNTNAANFGSEAAAVLKFTFHRTGINGVGCRFLGIWKSKKEKPF